jgi:uncharacterized protein (UPF0548 family)
MFLIGWDINARVRRISAAHKNSKFSYREVGKTRTLLPAEYHAQRDQFLLGEGSQVFFQARQAMRRWKMFDVPWVRLCWPDAPIRARSAVAIVAGGFGFWIVNLCRIVYVIDEPRRYGFAYGTLPEHVEAGEELFLVEWRDDHSVWYQVFAFSHEKHPLAKLAYPVARWLQKKFRLASGKAMQRASAIGATGSLRDQ